MNAIQLSEQVEDNVYKMIVQEKRQTTSTIFHFMPPHFALVPKNVVELNICMFVCVQIRECTFQSC